MPNKNPVGRPLSGRSSKKYWTDLKTHATIAVIVEARKLKKLTDDDLDNLVEIVRNNY